MRQITDRGVALIKRHEGFVAAPYRCPAGYLTVGYGHVLLPGERFEEGVNERQAEQLLEADVRQAEQAVLRLITAPLADGQFDALVSFTFNVGAGALQRSTLRACVNDSRHDDVPDQLMRWVWAGGRRLKGLVARRADEAAMYAGEPV